MRRDFQPANWATFQVPIRFTKFDIRDYLYNLYDVEVKAVRSWVRRPVAPTKNDSGRYVRPGAEKYMTVEMTKPFVWPDEPSDLSPWNNDMYTMREDMIKKQEKMQEERYKGRIPMASEAKLGTEEERYRTLAKQLLNGSKKWSNGVVLDKKWDALTAKKGEKKAEKKKAGKKTQEKAEKKDLSE